MKTRILTNTEKAEIINNWTYLLIGAQADLRKLPMNHGGRSYAEAQVAEYEAKIASFQAIETVEDIERKKNERREQLRGIMNRAHAIQKQALLIWGAVEFSECLKASWNEEKTGVRFAIVRQKQIFISFLKMRNVVEIKSELLTHTICVSPEFFAALKQRGVITPDSDNKFAESARLEVSSWKEFDAMCTTDEKKALRAALIRSQIAVTEGLMHNLQAQHRPCSDLHQKLITLNAALSA